MSGLGRALAAAQERWDNTPPPDDEIDTDIWLDEQSALERAADEISADPASIMFHLGHMVDEDNGCATEDELYGKDWVPDHSTAATLLSVLLEGSTENSAIARLELRARLAGRMRDDIAERAKELLAEQEKRLRDAADDSMDWSAA